MKKILHLFILLLLANLSQAQDLVHYWHFNNVNSDVDTVAADYTLLMESPKIIYQMAYPNVKNPGYMDDVKGTDLNAFMNEADGNGIRPRNPSDSMELFVELPTTGYQDATVSYAVHRSGSGMLKQVIWYTFNGTDYMQHPDTVYVTEDWERVSFNFSSMIEANNNPNFAIKIRFHEQNTASNGNNRIDNFALEGNMLEAEATVIHYWHFNTVDGRFDTAFADRFASDNAPVIIYRTAYPDVKNPGYMDDVSGTDINAQFGEPDGEGIRPRNPSDSMELFFELPTTGFRNIMLSYASERSGSGMLKQVIHYTIDGVNYLTHPDTVIVPTSYDLVEVDFSDIAGVANNENFSVIMKFLEQNTASNGNNRFDNVVLSGTSMGGEVEGVSLNIDKLTMAIGTKDSLWAMVLPANALNKEVTWSSTDNLIVSVDAMGNIEALRQGTSYIIATTVEGMFSDSCLVNVISPSQVSIKVESDGNPVENAEVTFNALQKMTDVAGEVSFEGLPGTYEINVSAEGYVGTNETINLHGDTSIVYSLKALSEAVVHYWHFNDMPLGTVTELPVDFTLVPDVTPTIVYEGTGNGYMDDYSPGSTLNAKFNTEAGVALRVRNRSHDKALIIPLPTTQCSEIMLSFDIHRSGSGMLINHFEYTLDGGATYQNTGITPLKIDVTENYTTHVIDFTAVEAANDNPDFGVRITWEGNTEQDNGNNRYDNIAMIAVTDLVSVSENSNNPVVLFPNPAKSNVYIKNAETGSNFSVLNIHGGLVVNGTISGTNHQLNTNNLAAGTYFLILHENTGIRTAKFVVGQ